MKIINFLLPNYGIKPVGGFKIVYLYANYLRKCGYNVNIVYAHSLREKNFQKYIFDTISIKLKKPTWYHLQKGIKEYFLYEFNDSTVPDADISVATAWHTAVALNKLGEQKGRKLYLIQHYEIWSGPKRIVDETWRYKMEKVVISKWLYNIGVGLGCSDMTYIPNSINYKKYKVTYPINDRGNTIAMLYSPLKWKGSKTGIAALKQVKEKIPNLRVMFFGVEERGKDIPKWIEYYQNPEQKFLVNEIYNKAAVFLCPSVFEGWGLPPMEAMACGCAVVSTKNGGVEDFAIHEQTALLCDVGDDKTMAEEIERLVTNDALRLRLVNDGMEYIKQFTWKKSFQSFRELIERH